MLAPDGQVVSARAISKIRAGERGAGYAERLLVQAGCPARGFGEEPRDWLARVLPGLRRLRHPGNFTYLFGLGRIEQRRLARLHPARLPYPKDHAVETAGVTLAA